MEGGIFKVVDFIDKSNQPCSKKNAIFVVCMNDKNQAIPFRIDRVPEDVEKGHEFFVQIILSKVKDGKLIDRKSIEE